jgi:NAD(P)-dependent dehydrogenase (short-subunit alcohol dehydrogenase family)
MGWLEGDVALITGAGSGLGRALVDRFVAEGARVLAFDRAADRLAAVESANPGSVVGVAGDVTVADDNERAVARALDQFGRLDTFIGNAGMFDYGAGLVDTPIDALDRAFDELFALNVKACLLGVKAAVPALMESRGSVLLTASMSSTHGCGRRGHGVEARRRGWSARWRTSWRPGCNQRRRPASCARISAAPNRSA